MSESLEILLWLNLWVGVAYGLYIRFQHNLQLFLLQNVKIKGLLYPLRFVAAVTFLYAAYLLSWVVFRLVYGAQRVPLALILPLGLIVSTIIGFLNTLASSLCERKQLATPEQQP